MKSAVWAVVPVKTLGNAKERLAPILSPAERANLSRTMLADVFNALAGCSGLRGVLVVTNDVDARSLSRKHGFDTLNDLVGTGPSEAVRRGLAHLGNQVCDGVLALMADIPLLTATDVDEMLAAHNRTPAVTLAPSRDGKGTNAAFCSPPDAIPLTFNGRGLAGHIAQGSQLNIETHRLDLPRLALDIDLPEDLAALLEVPSASKTQAYLRDIGGHRRLRDYLFSLKVE